MADADVNSSAEPVFDAELDLDTDLKIRKIIHIDMDAFYASVEQRDHPELKGQPVAVGGLPSQRGAVCAASYEARKFGIHSAMPSRSAIQRCEHLIYVKPRFEAYRAVSEQIRKIFFDFSDLVEPLSLDEAYLDVTVDKRGIGSAVRIAEEIRDRIKTETHLTASAGVSINKYLAKIASDLNKPDGLSLIAPDQAEAFIEKLPIEEFYGVGPATATKMKALGIHSGADLKSWTQAELAKAFGKAGNYYYKVARAEDNRPVNPNRIRKSVGAERSFAEDLQTLDAMATALVAIVDEVEARLLKAKKMGHTLTLKIKYADYRQITRSRTLDVPLQRAADMAPLAQALLEHHLEPRPRVRLLGVAMANLVPAETVGYQQLSLL